MAIDIVDLPIDCMVIFNSYVTNYRRVNGTSSINHDNHGTWEYSLEEKGGV